MDEGQTYTFFLAGPQDAERGGVSLVKGETQ